MNPEMMQKLMPFLAGAGMRDVVQNIEKMSKILGGGNAQKGQGQKQAAGPQGAAMPAPAPGAMPPSGQINPAVMSMLARMIQARGA